MGQLHDALLTLERRNQHVGDRLEVPQKSAVVTPHSRRRVEPRAEPPKAPRGEGPALRIDMPARDGLLQTISSKTIAAADSPVAIRIDASHLKPVQAGPPTTTRHSGLRVSAATATAERPPQSAPEPTPVPPAKPSSRRRVPEAVISMRDSILGQLPDAGELAISLVAVDKATGAERVAQRAMLADLATSFADLEVGDVVLVDARPELTVGNPSEAGLADLLGDQDEAHADWSDVIQTTDDDRIDRLVRGRGLIDTSTRGMRRMATLLDQLRQRYEYVLVHGGDGQNPETAAIAARCDAVYLLVGLDQTDRQQAQQVAETLRAAGAQVKGCVVAKPGNKLQSV
jgi:Mrp family chromosome partitioning ATPase